MSGRPLSRHNSAVSISSAVRASPTPSGSTSPVSPSTEGLSRRLSWNRPQDERFGVHDTGGGHSPSLGAQASTLAPPSHGFLPPDEHDLGSGWAPDFSQHGRPWSHNYPSETSLGGGSEFESPPVEEHDAYARLNGTSHQRVPSWRAYQPPGSAGPSRIADAVARSPTFRNMGRRIRNASIRVVNIMGADGNQHRMVRLTDEDEDGEGKEEFELDNKSPESPPEDIIPPPRPGPMPPENGLRGRTLCFFTPKSRIRRAMGAVMINPWTETIILVLIMASVVILTLQAAPQLNTTRQDNGYFQGWTDYALFGLFIVFTIEMFARIITTGLIFDPETNTREFLFGPQGLQKLLNPARNSLNRNTSFVAPRRAGWRSASGRPETHRKPTIIPEAPFQTAVTKSANLAAQNRPYLRHSWYRVDMLAVFAFWVTFFLALTGVEATSNLHLYIFRALSVLRAGRLLVVTSGTATILHSLKTAGPLLITVGYFVVFAGILFSIIGVQSFRGSFRRNCMYTDPLNSSNIIQIQQQCGGYLHPVTFEKLPYLQLDGTPALVKAKGYICPVGQTCETLSQNPEDNTQSFDDIFESAIQIVIIGSINTWTPVMYAMMDSDFYASCLFFIVGVVVINFWLLNLVVAVVVETFQNIRAETKRSAFGGDDSLLVGDPQWATKDKRHKPGIILRLYDKTYYFWVVVILAGLVAQATRTSQSSATKLHILYILELAFTLTLDLEMVIRVAGYIPDWRSFVFSSPRNIFDLFLAVFTSIIQIPAIQRSWIYPWFTIFQLLRWYRVILAVPRMRGLLLKLFAGLTGLINMVIFLLMVNFLAALLAVQIIRGDMPADVTMNFGQIYNAFLAVYQVRKVAMTAEIQIFSSENWTTVLYGAMTAEIPFVQTWLVAIFLCGWFLFSFFVVLQMFVAVIMENFAIAEEQKRKQQVEAFLRKAEPPAGHVSWIDRLNPYRLMSAHHHSVKVHSLPANLVLPMKQNIGQDVGGYSSSYPDPRSEVEAKGAMRRLLGFEQDDIALAAVKKRFRPRSMSSPKLQQFHDHHAEEDDRGLTDLLPPLNAGPSADEHLDAMRERRNQQADFISAHPSFDHSLWLFKQSNPIRKFCQACFEPAYGDRIFGRPPQPTMRIVMKAFMFLVIAGSITVAAIATPLYRKNYYAVHGEIRATWFVVVEVALGAIFILEALMKIIADGFIFCPNAYLLSIWNMIDFVILITLLINTTTSLIFIGGLSRFTRSLKAFRAIRLVTLFGRLRDTLHAVLFAGATLILDAAMFMILYLIPFAVWGTNIFAGRLFSCNNASAVGKSDCIGEYVNSPIDNSLNFLTPNVWSTPGLIDSTTVWSFDDFRSSLLILFEIVTLEGWIDVMTAGMNIVGTDLNTSTNNEQWNSIFYVTFNLLGAVIIFTLFTSVIIQNFSRRSGMAMFTVEQRNWVDLSKFIKSQTPSQLPKKRPTFGLRLWCYERATQKHGYWAWIFTFIYYIHILLLMFEDFGNNILTDNQLDWIFLFLTLIYAFDLLIRFYGLGVKSFFSNGWNVFDLVVITGSFITTIPALRATSLGLPGNEVNVQLQKLFLTAMALKLVQRLSALNQLFKTAIASLPAIGNLFLLWAILFIFFALMQLEVFGLTKMGNNSGSRYQNFYTFGNALVMLSFMSTGEGWNGYMHDYTVAPPRCTDNDNFLFSDCGSPSWAFGLFISWNIISMYIFLNMFTGVVVESFAYVYQMPGGASLNREDIRAFKRLWAEFDTERTGYIKRKDFVPFFSKLSGVFEVRPYPPEYTMQNLVRSSVPDPVRNASGKLVVASGVKQAVDVRRIGGLLRQLDPVKVRKRRQNFERLYHEARISDEHGRGISFTSMLLMLAHYNLIDDEKALQLDDLLIRRQKTERVTDLVNLDRVRGMLRTIYWRKRFMRSREERKRTLNAEAEGIPAIVLEPTPASPPMEEEDDNYPSYEGSHSPSSSRRSSPAQSPTATYGQYPWGEIGLGIREGHVPDQGHSALSPFDKPLSRQVSNSSMLSSEDAQYRRDSPIDELPAATFDETPASAMWGDMMREAVDDENDER